MLVSFAANSLITRHVVAAHLLDAGLLSAVRLLTGALALVIFAFARRKRLVVGQANVRPTLWLGVYAVCISYGYRHSHHSWCLRGVVCVPALVERHRCRLSPAGHPGYYCRGRGVAPR